MKILLIAGGWSTEREVSLTGAKGVETALKSLNHEVTFFDLTPENFSEICDLARKHDFVFLNLHGSPGEDGLIQAMLQAVSCPYQGSGPAGSLLALRKAAAKEIFRAFNLPTPDWEFLPAMPARSWVPAFAPPWFVKSDAGGSSLRLGRADNLSDLRNWLETIFSAGEQAIIEGACKGKDLTCGVLGERALPPVLIEPQAGDFFDFKSKYAKDGARETCPAPLQEEINLKAQEYALKAHKVLGLKGYSRTDFILSETGELSILEVNTLPGMTPASLFPKEAEAIGISFPQLLQELIRLGLEDHCK